MYRSHVPRFVLLDINNDKVIYIESANKVYEGPAEVEIVVPKIKPTHMPYIVKSNTKAITTIKGVKKLYGNLSFSTKNVLIAYSTHTYDIDEDLKIVPFDIEVATSGSGPDPKINKILTIGYAIDDGPVDILYTTNKASDSDKVIIKKFIDILISNKIGIITGYNSARFDIPYIIQRAYVLGMMKDIMKLAGRFTELRSHLENTVLKGDSVSSDFGVILHHDVYKDVHRDQSLGKIKHRTMKNVGNYLLKEYVDKGEIKILEMERHELINMAKVWDSTEGRNKIIEYQESDVELQRKLSYEVYTTRLVNIANNMDIPLNVVFDMSASTMLQIDLLRRLRDNNMIITNNNHNQFRSIYIRANKLGSKHPYQGAWTEAFKKGKFTNIKKFDYKSLYPSIIDTFNLSYETTTIIDTEYLNAATEINQNEEINEHDIFSVTREEDNLLIRIYDKNQQAIFTIKVDMTKRGLIPKMISDYRDMRNAAKKMMKKYPYGSKEYIKYDSNQQEIKVKNNSIYGLISNTNLPGWLPAGMLTTAIGRHLAKKMIDYLQELGAEPIELDSVTGDTPIWIRKDGDIYITRIDELCKGKTEKRTKLEGYETWTRHGWKKINYVKQHRVTKPIHRITTMSGYVKVTSDHSLFDSKQREISPRDIIPNRTRLEIAPLLDSKNQYSDFDNLVLRNDVIYDGEYDDKEVMVYDISTEDGTFVTVRGGIVLHNTDGLLVAGDVDIDVINNKLKSYIEMAFGIKRENISVELEKEVFNKLFLHRAKNYILQEKEGEYPIIHGSALKSSKRAKVMDRMVDIIIDYIIFEKKTKEEALNEIFHIEDLSIDYFILTTRFTKDLSRYDKPTEVIKEAQKLAKLTGEDIGEGYQLEYIMVTNPLTGRAEPLAVGRILQEKLSYNIAYSYYKEQMENQLIEMGLIDSKESVSDDIFDILLS